MTARIRVCIEEVFLLTLEFLSRLHFLVSPVTVCVIVGNLITVFVPDFLVSVIVLNPEVGEHVQPVIRIGLATSLSIFVTTGTHTAILIVSDRVVSVLKNASSVTSSAEVVKHEV